MSSLRALCCLLSVKEQKHDFHVCFLQLHVDLFIAIYFLNQLLFNFSHIVHILCAAELYIFTCLEINYRFCSMSLPVPLTVMTIFFHSMYNKTIITFGFCDIHNNQGLCKGYQPQPSPSDDNPYLNLDYSGYHINLIQ